MRYPIDCLLIVHCWAVQWCPVVCNAVQCCAELCRAVQSCAVLCGAVRYGYAMYHNTHHKEPSIYIYIYIHVYMWL